MDSADALALLAQDEAARAAALDPRRSFLLQAPAGSGKTTVLTSRLLALLAIASEPEEILAITFTRKAAAEMRGRVLGALAASAAGTDAGERIAPLAAAALARDRERGWNLLGNPTRLRIQTIDAFCQRIASQLPVSSRAGGGRELALPATASYRAAARRVIERALDEPALLAAARDLLLRLDNDWGRLEHLLELMLAARSHWLPRLLGSEVALPARVGEALQALVRARLAALGQAFDPALLAEGARLAAHAARNLQAEGLAGPGQPELDAWLASQGPLRPEPDDLPRWRLMAWLLLTGGGSWRKRHTKNEGVPPRPPAFKEDVQAWLQSVAVGDRLLGPLLELQRLPDARLAGDDAAALAGFSQLLQQAAAELEVEFVQRGQVDHVAVAGAARAALSADGAPTDLALRCGEAIHHVLIDEFQDTSLEQFSLLRALTAGWNEGDGRTLFAVGDPMQSIYQFREAEVGLFLQARHEGIGTVRLESLHLRRNFRSRAGVIDWVNDACARIFPAHDDPWHAAISYLPALPARSEPGGQVQVHALADDSAEDEAACIARLAVAERARDPACTIAVLVPARRHAGPIAAALRAAGLPVRGLKLEALSGRTVVRDLGALARALAHPGDATAWLALLRAPWCGLSMTQLHSLAGAMPCWERLADPLVLAALGAEGAARVARVQAALMPAIAGHERQLPLAQRVERTWLRLGGPAACTGEGEGEGEGALRDAEAFLAALDDLDEREWTAGESLAELIDELFAPSEAQAGAVDILTVHGAKGLEWDVVFLPAIGRATRGDERPLLQWLDLPADVLPGGLLLAPIEPVGERRARTLADYIGAIKAERRQLERSRLLYVAATRARHGLHWLGHAPRDKEGQLRPRSGTALARLWPVLADGFDAALGQEATPAPVAGAMAGGAPANAVAAGPALRRLAHDWSMPPLPPPVQPARLAVGAPPSQHAPEYSWVGLAARLVGTLVHAELQRLSSLATLPDASTLRAADYLPRLAELGLVGGEAKPAAERIVAALAATLCDPQGRWLLGEGGGEAHSELRLAGLHEGRLVTISMDRVRADRDGVRWVVDYKTGTHEGGDLEAFLLHEAERYSPQLARYRQVGSALWGSAPRTALYFPLIGVLREVLP